MSEAIKIYQKPSCSVCREAVKLLRDRGVPFESVDYLQKPVTKERLRELIRKLDVAPRNLLRVKEETYRKLNLAKRNLTDDELVSLMVAYPQLIQRPIIEIGDRAVLGRPLEKIKQLIDGG